MTDKISQYVPWKPHTRNKDLRKYLKQDIRGNLSKHFTNAEHECSCELSSAGMPNYIVDYRKVWRKQTEKIDLRPTHVTLYMCRWRKRPRKSWVHRIGYAGKSAGWMPWHWEPMKDVISCEKLRGGANIHWSGDFRMGKPSTSHVVLHLSEHIG